MRSTRRPRDRWSHFGAGSIPRRRVLTGAIWVGVAGLVAGGVSGCDPDSGDDPSAPGSADGTAIPEPEPEPDPDLGLLETNATLEERLVATYDATLAAHPGLGELIAPLRANHREQLAYLGGLAALAAAGPLPSPLPAPADVAAPTPTATEQPTETDQPTGNTDEEPEDGPTTDPPNGSAAAEEVPGSAPDALSALSTAETDAATAHLRDVRAASSGDVARLCASLRACELSHALRIDSDGGAYVS